MADRLKAETLADIIRAHKAARMTDNREKMASLEQALADFNYHSIRDLMAAAEYHEALRGQHGP
jgi:uncharacterized protein YheU (UPF0270 family)